MTARIFKYPLDVEHRQLIMMPVDARPLCVVEQNEQLVMYAEVPQPVGVTQPRVFRVVTTGDTYEADHKRYVGSTMLGGWFIAHVFELFESGLDDPIDLRSNADFHSIRQEQNASPV